MLLLQLTHPDDEKFRFKVQIPCKYYIKKLLKTVAFVQNPSVFQPAGILPPHQFFAQSFEITLSG